MPKGIPKNGTGGQFKKKDDPRRNQLGQRSASVVAFNRSLREIIAGVGNEEVKSGTASYTRVELMVRGLYVKASKGDVSAFSALVERVEGKVAQGVKHEFADLTDAEIIANAARLVGAIAATVTAIGSGDEAPGTHSG